MNNAADIAGAAAQSAFSAYNWINIMVIGLLAGAAGQGARAVVGLKKVSDTAQSENVATKDLIEPSRLATSLLIGAIAGLFGAISLIKNVDEIGMAIVLEIAAVGYAGADAIEGFISRVTPAGAKPPNPASDSSAAADGALG